MQQKRLGQESTRRSIDMQGTYSFTTALIAAKPCPSINAQLSQSNNEVHSNSFTHVGKSSGYRSRCGLLIIPSLKLVLLLLSLALLVPNSMAQNNFVLRIQDAATPNSGQQASLASLTEEQLVVQDAAGTVTVYSRLRRYDTPDGQFIAYGSREAQRVIQWPTANRGPMRIGTLQNGRIEFTPSRMAVFATEQRLSSDGGYPLGQSSGFEAFQNGEAANTPTVILRTGEGGNQGFLRVSSSGGLQLVPQANDAQAAWVITPVGGDMVRVQQAVGNQWAALAVDQRDLQGFGNGALAQRGARAQIRFTNLNNSFTQLWRIQQQFGGGYCFESVAMPGFGITCVPNQGLWLQPIVYSPWQIWWAQQPTFAFQQPQYRIANEQIVANPPLPPIQLRITNSHADTLVVLLADRRNPNAPRKLRIPAGGSEVVILERDSGATIQQTTEFMDGFGNWDRQSYQIPVPPTVLYDISVYEEFLQSIAIDRTGKSPNPIEDVNYQPRSVGFLLLPPGDQLQDHSVLDVYRAAADSRNPGAVRRLSPSDYQNSSSQSAVQRDPLKDLLQQLQGKRGAF